MAWYYAVGGERRGPIDDRAFQQLVTQGTVGPDTLVWREGMAEWQPYGDVALDRPAPPPPEPMEEPLAAAPERPTHDAPAAGAGLGGERMCTACGNTFPADELVELEGRSICGACKPTFVQHLREGNTLVYGMIYAGFWRRFAAMILDGFIIGIPLMIVFFIIIFAMFGSLEQSDPQQAEIMFQFFNTGFQLVYLGITLAYNTYFLGKSGATPGK
jgi:hypothetical protein